MTEEDEGERDLHRWGIGNRDILGRQMKGRKDHFKPPLEKIHYPDYGRRRSKQSWPLLTSDTFPIYTLYLFLPFCWTSAYNMNNLICSQVSPRPEVRMQKIS